MFKCKVCSEKDKRIDDLQSQIAMLRAMVTPPSTARDIPILQVEADAVLSGKQDPIGIPESQLLAWDQRQSEAHRILAGTYE